MIRRRKKINSVREGKADLILSSNNAVPDDFALLKSMGSMPCYIGISLKRPDILDDMNRAQQEINLNRPDFEGYLVKRYFYKDPINKKLTAEEKSWIAEHKVLKIGAYNEDYPYCFVAANGKTAGVMPDALKIMLERLNLPLEQEWKLYNTRKDLIKALHFGEVDIIIPEYHDLYDADVNNIMLSDSHTDVVMGALCKGKIDKKSMDIIAVMNTETKILQLYRFLHRAIFVLQQGVMTTI